MPNRQRSQSEGTPAALDEPDRLDPDPEDLKYAWRALSVVGLASIVSALNTSALNTALPTVVRHFNATSSEASWILITFLLVSTVVTLVCGRAADMMGRRSMYLWGLGLFTGASFLLGLAPNVQVLIGLRVVQAVAGSMLLVNSAAIVSAAFPERMLARGLGIYMASFSIAQLVGPPLGGARAPTFGWEWVFWFNVPVGVLCFVWGAMTLRKVETDSEFTGLDIRGNVLLFLGLGGLIVALSEAASLGWTSPLVLGGALCALIFLPTFISWERRVAHPVLDLSLFSHRPFAMANASGFINTVARGSVIIIAALYFQAVYDVTALHAGLQLLPLAAANAIASSSLGGLTNRWSSRTVAAIGSAITSAGLIIMFAATGTGASYPYVCVGLIVVGLGSGVFMPANISSILEDTDDDQVGIINAVRITVQSTGIVIGTALALTILTAPLAQDVRQAVFAGTVSALGNGAVDQLIGGYRWAFGAMVVISLIGIATSLASSRAQKAHAASAPASADVLAEV
ncbi:MAG: stp 2 [Jatrophihabitantaceae bacterium]|nr:stp 2 [Jatrophihabitantaceae bacterium]